MGTGVDTKGVIPYLILSQEMTMRVYYDGMRYAAKLIREYEPEHNKLYRERLAKFLEEKAK